MRAMPWRRPRAACLALLLGLTLAEEKWSVPQQEHTSSIWGLIHGLRPPVVFRLGYHNLVWSAPKTIHKERRQGRWLMLWDPDSKNGT